MTTLPLDCTDCLPRRAELVANCERLPWPARVTSWLANRRRQKHDAGIAAFVTSRGGMITDDLERQIDLRFLRGR
jgi:hypothetical protein